MGLRHRSIRLRVILLVLIPLVSLIGVYSFATSTTARTAVDLVRAGNIESVTVNPTTNFVQQIDAERSLAVAYLVDPTTPVLARLNRQEARTDVALRKFEGVSMSGPLAPNASPLEKSMAATLISATRGVPGLPGLRASVAANGITRQAAISQYTALALDGYRVIYQAIETTGVRRALVTTALQQTQMFAAAQYLLEENDLYTGDAAARSFPAADRIEFAQLVALRRNLMTEALPQLDASSSGLYHRYVSPKTAANLARLENTIIHTPTRRGAPPVPVNAWLGGMAAYTPGLAAMLTKGKTAIVAQVKSSARSAVLTLILAGGLGLLAIIASVVFSILIGRGLLRQLRELRQSALELAHEQLPSVMQRLRDGEAVDVALEAPPVESSADEIDQVRQAFHVVQRAAIEAAVDEANLRRGVSDVFRNLARRSQVLLHRQLRLLDGMERRASDPGELEDLFRIDHLTTRMRRHAEGLIILSGESAGRTWRHPVPFTDVLRAAVAEVEDYTRIRVDVRSRAALAGAAVADVIHLIAELAENATVFSPPNTPVRIHGDTVGRGFAVEVEDRGLGITEERLAEINRNLSSPPAFDLSGSDRLGLFIAGQLARRHDIKITLRPSSFGGTTAIVVIPLQLVVDEGTYEGPPAYLSGPGRGLPLSGRHAALAEGRGINGTGAGDPATPRPGEPGSSWLPGARSAVTALPAATAAPAALPVATLPPGTLPAEMLPTRQVPTTQAPDGQAPDGQAPDGQAPDGQAESDPVVATPVSAVLADDGEPIWPGPAAWSEPVRPAASDGPDRDDLDSRITTADLGNLGANLEDFGLPVRVRQASLAPQLRDPVQPDPSRPDDGSPAAESRQASPARQASPEAARNTMSALQRGWERGRSESPSATGDTAGETAPGESGQ